MNDEHEVDMKKLKDRQEEANEEAQTLDKKQRFQMLKMVKKVPKLWNQLPYEDQALIFRLIQNKEEHKLKDFSLYTPEGEKVIRKLLK